MHELYKMEACLLSNEIYFMKYKQVHFLKEYFDFMNCSHVHF